MRSRTSHNDVILAHHRRENLYALVYARRPVSAYRIDEPAAHRTARLAGPVATNSILGDLPHTSRSPCFGRRMSKPCPCHGEDPPRCAICSELPLPWWISLDDCKVAHRRSVYPGKPPFGTQTASISLLSFPAHEPKDEQPNQRDEIANQRNRRTARQNYTFHVPAYPPLSAKFEPHESLTFASVPREMAHGSQQGAVSERPVGG